MTLMGRALEYRQLRVPREHGTALVEPPVSATTELVEDNVALRRSYDVDCQGRSLSQLADQARAELVQQARDYTRQYHDVDAGVAPEHVFLAGHQPQLFHAGVWFKHFMLDRLARRHGAVAVNLLIDNDTMRSASLRVPGGSVHKPTLHTVPLDRPGEEIPYEERRVLDDDLFASFGRRVCETIAPLVKDPMIARLWPWAIEAHREGKNLGQCCAQARHRLEGRRGLSTLELPQSVISDGEPFRWFSACVLAQLPRFWRLYNGSLAEFRRVERVRSRSHPVPDLACDDGWCEAPFWIWSRDNPRRRRLFARQHDGQIELTDRGGIRTALALRPDGDGQVAVDQLGRLPDRGIKLRPRALMTTMFARLFLGDVFLHGIGGAKYDQLTDQLIRRFFSLEPMAFLVLSATAMLPIDRETPAPDDVRRVDRLLRELVFHPEHHVDLPRLHSLDADEVAVLIATKKRWILTELPRGQRRRRHFEICRASESLQPFVEAKRRTLLEERSRLASSLAKEVILASREYAFCLFPEENLCNLILDLLPKEP